MKVTGLSVVVTGGANGIGRALARRFAREGARGVLIADRDEAGARVTAEEVGGIAVAADLGTEEGVRAAITAAEAAFGHVDLFCANAGIGLEGGAEVPDAEWQRIWNINVMSHVWAARALVPGMIARGSGAFLQTVSAAGLLMQIGSAPYSVTKHAALSFAEWLAVTYGDQGIQVFALCPQGVKTNMLFNAEFGNSAFLLETALDPDQVAEAVVQGFEAGNFLILPHPEVAEFFRRKAADYDRWLRGMRKLQDKIRVTAQGGH
ncbi:MAG: SDR family oxidoreductase [Acidobacteria bacterium]|nr:SDR family oxidoreductase [Acidobacteriota bacterium]